MTNPTPPRGDAPEKLWISGAPRKLRGSHWWMAHDYYSFKEQVPYIPEARAEERIAEARATERAEAFNRAAAFAGHYFSQDGADPAVFKIKLQRMAQAARSGKVE